MPLGSKNGACCYIVCSWGGSRRSQQHPRLVVDGALYLREHVKRVLAFCKGIDQLVVASPMGNGFHKGYEEYLAELGKLREVNGIPIEVFRRDNTGLSFGAYNDIFGKYRTKFDYYLVAEDDYIPMIPGFDQILFRMIEGLPKCGFLCGLASPGAGIFMGIIRAIALEKIWVKNGCLARFSGCTYHEAEQSGQIGMSMSILDAGYDIVDWTKTYSSPFWNCASIRTFGDPKLPSLFVPAQTFHFT